MTTPAIPPPHSVAVDALPMRETTAAEFAELAAGKLHGGDLVLFRRAPANESFAWRIAWAMVERVQRRLLRDLGVRMNDCDIRAASAFVHAALNTAGGECVEMTSPRCRVLPWTSRLAPGDSLIVRRAVDHPPGFPERDVRHEVGIGAAVRALMDVGERYPFSELLRHYLWSWGVRKLVCRQRFARVFGRNPGHCAGAVWRWLNAAGAWPYLPRHAIEAIPAGHYPAELTISNRFRTVCAFRIVAVATSDQTQNPNQEPQP